MPLLHECNRRSRRAHFFVPTLHIAPFAVVDGTVAPTIAVNCHQSVAELSLQTAKVQGVIILCASRVRRVEVLFAPGDAANGYPEFLHKITNAT